MKQRTVYLHVKPTVKRMIVACLVAIGLISGSVVNSWANPPEQKPAEVTPITDEAEVLMQAKLTSSKKVLEGLLRRDFDTIARAAREMKRISKATAWPRPHDEVYSHFSNEFQRQCNQLESHADQLNHEAAQFTFLHMTTTCIQCHDYIRDSRRMADVQGHSNVRPIPSQWDNTRPPNK